MLKPMPFSFRKYRYIAYRQLVGWCWGFLGKGNRVPLPACALDVIRTTFPPEGDIVGFKYPTLTKKDKWTDCWGDRGMNWLFTKGRKWKKFNCSETDRMLSCSLRQQLLYLGDHILHTMLHENSSSQAGCCWCTFLELQEAISGHSLWIEYSGVRFVLVPTVINYYWYLKTLINWFK
jgi:hypothetical protein